MGITIREIVEDIGGGMQDGRHVQGGAGRRPVGRLHPGAPRRHAASTTRNWRRPAPSWARAASSCSTTATAPWRSRATSCTSRRASRAASARSAASARKRMLEILERICAGKGAASRRPRRRSTNSATRVKTGSLCGLGQTAPNPVLTTLRYFRDEYEAHIRERRCPAGVVQGARSTTACSTTARAARCAPRRARPAAIERRPYQRHEVTDDLCTRCGMCVTACPEPRDRGGVMAPMVTLTIDGQHGRRSTTGTTILDAARGARHPHPHALPRRRLPAVGVVLPVRGAGRGQGDAVAVVRHAGRRRAWWSTPTRDDVRASRKMALELLLSDHVGDCIGPCTTGCPARFDIPGFLTQRVGRRRSAQAGRDRVGLPRRCPRRSAASARGCASSAATAATPERRCRSAALHRFAADRGPGVGRRATCRAATPPTGKRVAIVGAGPGRAHGRLPPAAARPRRHHLRRPRRTPAACCATASRRSGCRTTCWRGRSTSSARSAASSGWDSASARDVTLDDAAARFDAVFLAIGAQALARPRLPGRRTGATAPSSSSRRSRGGRPHDIGDDVLVLGGGNTAMDASRTAVRLGARRSRCSTAGRGARCRA